MQGPASRNASRSDHGRLRKTWRRPLPAAPGAGARLEPIWLAALMLAAPALHAQTPPTAGSVLRETAPRSAPPVLPPPAPLALPAVPQPPSPSPAPGAAGGPTFVLRQVSFTGNSVFSAQTLAPLVADQIGRTVGFAELQAIAARITDYYHAAGYVLTQVVLPPQDVNAGQVQLSVVEGRLGQIRIERVAEIPMPESLIRRTVAGLKRGEPLNRRELERAMLLLSDLPGLAPQSSLESGNEPGTFDLIIELKPGARSNFSVDADNYGSRATGEYRLGAFARFNSPLRHGDNLDMRLLTSSGKGLVFGRIGYETPLGAPGLRAGIAYSHLDYELGKELAPLDAHGRADVFEVSLNHPLLRSRLRNLFARVSFEHKDLNDRIGVVAQSSDKTIDSLGAGVVYRGARHPLERRLHQRRPDRLLRQAQDRLGARPRARPGAGRPAHQRPRDAAGVPAVAPAIGVGADQRAGGAGRAVGQPQSRQRREAGRRRSARGARLHLRGRAGRPGARAERRIPLELPARSGRQPVLRPRLGARDPPRPVAGHAESHHLARLRAELALECAPRPVAARQRGLARQGARSGRERPQSAPVRTSRQHLLNCGADPIEDDIMTALANTFPPQRRMHAPRRTLISMAVALALVQYGNALAGPGGAQVVAGQVAVSQPSAQQTVVTQGSASAILNWQQFSIARNESVDFRQPGSASVILNRVTGSNPSEIYGRLSANGQVFLVNPGGVLFGRTAQVNVGGLVASTLDIADADFLAGRYHFSAGATGGAVVNQGQLQAAERGTVALLGAKVNNDGTISAQLGTAALVAGDKIALDFNGDGLTKIRVDKAAVAAQVDNRGMVVADGGQAILTAHAAQALAETVLNQQGVVRAHSLVERNGKISLDGGAQGETRVSGTLDVSGSAPGLKGGTAEVLGNHVGLVGNALVDARGDAGGGTILVGGDYRGANPLVRNADATFAGPATALRADAISSGDGGKLIVWSDNATRVFGSASATGGAGGGNGGFIETSGKYLSVAGARISAAAPRGKGGQWLLDPYSILHRQRRADEQRRQRARLPKFGRGGARVHQAIEGQLNNGVSVTVSTGGDPRFPVAISMSIPPLPSPAAL